MPSGNRKDGETIPGHMIQNFSHQISEGSGSQTIKIKLEWAQAPRMYRRCATQKDMVGRFSFKATGMTHRINRDSSTSERACSRKRIQASTPQKMANFWWDFLAPKFLRNRSDRTCGWDVLTELRERVHCKKVSRSNRKDPIFCLIPDNSILNLPKAKWDFKDFICIFIAETATDQINVLGTGVRINKLRDTRGSVRI